MIAAQLRTILAAGLAGFLSLPAIAADGSKPAPVTDPLDAVLDPKWKPQQPPAPPPEKVEPAASSSSHTVGEQPKRRRPQEDRSLFNEPTLLPQLPDGEVAGLNLGAGLGTLDDATELQLTGRIYLTNDVVLGDTINHALSSNNPAQPSGDNRKFDHDEWRDYLRLIQRFDISGSGVRLALGKLGNVNLGESGLIQHLNNNLLADTPRLGILFRTDQPTWWLELMVADATWLSPVTGAQLGLRPAGNSDSRLLSSLRVSAHYAGDQEAPLALNRDLVAKTVAVAEERRPLYSNQRVHGFGADVALRPLQAGMVYGELFGAYNALLSHGNGIHGGARLGISGEAGAFELRGEVRSLGANYLPHYFDSFYDVQRANYLTGSAATSAMTKLQFLNSLNTTSRTQNFFGGANLNLGRSLGVEASYETGGYAYSSIATLHVQLAASDEVTLFGTYQRRNYDSEGGFFKFDRNELVVARARFKLSSTWFLTGFATRTFIFDTGSASGGEYRPTWSGGGSIEWLVGT